MKSYYGKQQVFDIQGEKVTIGTYSYATQKKIAMATKSASESEGALASIDVFLVNTIKDWSLTNEAGEKLAITSESFETLSGSFMNELIKKANEFNSITAEEIKN